MENLRGALRFISFICKSAVIGAVIFSATKVSVNFIFSLLQTCIVLIDRMFWEHREGEEPVNIEEEILPFLHQDMPGRIDHLSSRDADPLRSIYLDVLTRDIPNLASWNRRDLFTKTALLTYPDMPASQKCQRLYLVYFMQKTSRKDEPSLWELAKTFFPDPNDPRKIDAALFRGYIVGEMFLLETPSEWKKAIDVVSQIQGFQDVCAWNRFLITKTVMDYQKIVPENQEEFSANILSACQTLIQRNATLLKKECEQVFLDAFPDHSSPGIAHDESRLPFSSGHVKDYLIPEEAKPVNERIF